MGMGWACVSLSCSVWCCLVLIPTCSGIRGNNEEYRGNGIYPRVTITAVLPPLNLTFHLQSSTNLIAPAVSRNPGARASHAVVNLNPAEHITSAGPNHKTQKNQDFLFRPPLRYYSPFLPRVKSAKCTRNLLADWTPTSLTGKPTKQTPRRLDMKLPILHPFSHQVTTTTTRTGT